MLYDESTREFDQLFKNMDLWQPFTSALPPHEVIQQSLADPSILADSVDTNTSIHEGYSIGRLNFGAVRDLQFVTRKALQKIVLPADPTGTHGWLKADFGALTKIMEFQPLIENMSDIQVYDSLGVPRKNAGATVAKVAFGVGMTALSAMGPVGAAAAAIIGFAAAIINAFRSRRVRADQEREERIQEAYKYFPRLQEPREEVDTWTVNNRLMPIMQTGDWTPIFLPRFKGDRWVVVERVGGFAMAPGETLDSKNPLTERQEAVFNPTGGIGFLPGANAIKSVVQVSLPEQDPRTQKWIERGSPFPLLPSMVKDVGSFLVNTTRLAAIAWSWVASKDNSPHLYKVDTHRLHEGWRTYCESGIAQIVNRPPNLPPREFRNLFVSAIACSIGGWRCTWGEGRHNVLTHGGSLPEQMNRNPPATFHPNRPRDRGCLIDYSEPAKCLTNVYELRARGVFDQLRSRQWDALGRTLLCAYVRSSWAAFEDPELRLRLDQMRGILLQHPDRMHVNIADVPPEEMHEGESLRTRLLKSGVPAKKTANSFAARLSGLEPSTGDAPTVEGDDVAMPFGGLVVEPYRPPLWRRPAVIGGAAAAAAIATYFGLRNR